MLGAIFLLAISALIVSLWPYAQRFEFRPTVLAENLAGDGKASGDIDGDGFPDLVIAGSPGEDLVWLRYLDKQQTRIARPTVEFTTDVALADIDGDDDLDIIVPDGDGPDNLKLFLNPRPVGNPSDPLQWQQRIIGTIGTWTHDIETEDFDANGRMDVVARTRTDAMIFYQENENSWLRKSLQVKALGLEGLAAADIDGDGDPDLVFRGAWLSNPGQAAARNGDAWTEQKIGTAPEKPKILASDLDRNGLMDIAYSNAEGDSEEDETGRNTGVVVYLQLAPGKWQTRVVAVQADRSHTLQAGDLDNDGDNDLMIAQMHTSEQQRIMVAENKNGDYSEVAVHVVGDGGLHNGLLVDLDLDGDLDIYGSNFTGNPPLRVLVNETSPSPNRWTSIRIGSDHVRTFGLAFADVDDDCFPDVLSGPFVYLNPKGKLEDTWQREGLPAKIHALAAGDVNSDSKSELFGQHTEGEVLVISQLLRDGPGNWSYQAIGRFPQTSHEEGSQGVALASLLPSVTRQLLVTTGDGLYILQSPSRNEQPWTSVQLSTSPSDEGIDVADIDDDGLPDVLATTGDNLHLEWYRNPGRLDEAWETQLIAELAGFVFPDRVVARDFDGDGWVDVAVTEENGKDEGAKLLLFRQVSDGEWAATLLTRLGSLNSLGAGDFDGDGDIDLVTGEHRGKLRTIVFNNDGHGHFTPEQIARGEESHLGLHPYDLDLDGDLDLVSIAWDKPEQIWLWRNDH